MHISGHTKLAGFLGHPSKHSLSPAMHNAAYQALGIDMAYLAFDVDQDAIGDAIQAVRTLQMVGVNVSMPNKTAVMDHLDRISEEAKLAGAVNTVVNQNGLLTGYNTDLTGAMAALREAGVGPAGKRVMVFGAGGAGTAILAGFTQAGAAQIKVGVRGTSLEKYGPWVETLRQTTGADLEIFPLEDTGTLQDYLNITDILVNATNVGMGPLEGQSILPDASYLPASLAVMDVIYQPAETELLKQAKAAGCAIAINGKAMLLHQGADAFRLMTGQEMPLDVVRKAWEG